MAQALVEQRQNIGRLATFEVDKDGGDNLRVLVANKVGGALRFHKVERFDAAGGIARFENIFQQAGGTLFAQRLDQHGTQVVVGVDVQRRKLFGFVFKLRQHFGQLFVGDLAHVGHGAALRSCTSRGERCLNTSAARSSPMVISRMTLLSVPVSVLLMFVTHPLADDQRHDARIVI